MPIDKIAIDRFPLQNVLKNGGALFMNHDILKEEIRIELDNWDRIEPGINEINSIFLQFKELLENHLQTL